MSERTLMGERSFMIWRTVFRKEALDAWRDRRSLTSALVYALLGPLTMGMALLALARSQDDDAPLRLAISGASTAPALTDFLAERRVTLVDAPQGAVAAVRGRLAEVAIEVPAGYARDLARHRPAGLRLVFDSSRAEGRGAVRRARALLAAYEERLRSRRLVAMGVVPEAADPLDLGEVDVASAPARASAPLAMLPLFLLLAAFVSSMNVAIDTTAGERERGSLEPLLLHPAPRLSVALGKWLAAAALGVAGTVLTLVVSRAVLAQPRLQALDVPLSLGSKELVAILLILLPLALLAPAIQMLLALFSRSYKEAQTWLSLLLFAPMLPGFLFAFGSVPVRDWMRLTPLVGHQVLISEALRGESPGMAVAGLAALSLGAALACVAATARLFSEERIVFGR